MSDNSFSISTSQNVTIQYEVAGLGERILARILDGLIKAGYTFGLILIVLILKDSQDAAIAIAVILALPLLFYTLLFETMMQGQTPGKKFRKIKVVRIDGDQATFGAYFLRWLFLLIDLHILYGIIGVLCIAINKKGQRLGDIVAETTVIKESDTVSLRDTIYEKLHSTHVITYQEVTKLTAEDVALIKKVLNTPEYLDNYDMVYTLTNKIQAKMDITRSETFPQTFLETVIKDYNALHDA
ncbi:MAG: RDD family protein [Bacteroidetes bacterium]|nr:RDD family protein [Bacteroidota bacterium]